MISGMTCIGIVGTRRRNTKEDYDQTLEALINLMKRKDLKKQGIIIVSGLCPKGGDEFARQIVEKYNLNRLFFPAMWQIYRKSAGFVRNKFIAENSEYLIACVTEDRTGGTEDTVKHFLKDNDEEKLILV